MHIPPELILPQDLVDMFDHGPEDERHAEPVKMRVHVTDAKHAMDVEPKRYTLHAKPDLKLVEEEEEPSDV